MTSAHPRGDASRSDRKTTGPGTPCAWCRKPIPDDKRSDAKTCGKGCRQSAWRFAQHGVVAAAAGETMRLAYADPPYPGKAHLYRGHADYAGEVDHRELLLRLAHVSAFGDGSPDFNGWALSTSSAPGLQIVLGLCTELGIRGVRVASWHRGARKVKSHTPWPAWEAVVYKPARSVALAGGGVEDTLEHFSRPRLSDPDRVIGAKPAAFAFWIFQLLGAAAGDTLADLFPGSGGITRAWDLFQGKAS